MSIEFTIVYALRSVPLVHCIHKEFAVRLYAERTRIKGALAELRRSSMSRVFVFMFFALARPPARFDNHELAWAGGPNHELTGTKSNSNASPIQKMRVRDPAEHTQRNS